ASVIHCHQYGTRRLTSNLAGLQRHSVLTVLKRFAHFIEHCFSLQNKKTVHATTESRRPRLYLGEPAPGITYADRAFRSDCGKSPGCGPRGNREACGGG